MWPLRAYLDAITHAKPALGRLLQELHCAALLLHNRVALFHWLLLRFGDFIGA